MMKKFGILSMAALPAMTAGAMETVGLNGHWDFRFERGK